ncbi:elongation factor Ts [Leptospira ryugenii]|uniref:Elongation factor Ts n=1 Tax=Leptospira ryugenii TaxID=1917863 RepID=A0A2P2E1G0_9LEPT|nr:translation elongation factor Ts [Leptospira ryugenii]GBF50728.1 elongation factor Ts [Leptospira ryugenii]
MAISSDLIKDLRERTGAGMMDCKKALEENNGDIEKSVTYLREKGLAKAAKRAGRETGEGKVISYVHGNGKTGVILELNCETDFVANNSDFEALGKEIALQITAMSPLYVSETEIPASEIENESKVQKALLEQEGKKPEQIEKILPGKLKKYYEDICLLNQKSIRDNSKTVNDLLQEAIAKFGENITIRRFARFQVGGQ